MCGRFTLTVAASVLAEVFVTEAPPDHEPRFNIAPTQMVPVVRATDSDRRRWSSCRWGLIPSWARDRKIGNRLINARSETAASKPSFRAALAQRRCLVPSDGFYEWVKTASGKAPFHIRFEDRRPFALAGLWERWRGAGEEPVESFTILTTEANEVVGRIHQRMPVLLAPGTWSEWLQPGPLQPQRLEELFAPFSSEGMDAVEVGRRVNSPFNDDPACLDPAP